jgi:hypothetical protein
VANSRSRGGTLYAQREAPHRAHANKLPNLNPTDSGQRRLSRYLRRPLRSTTTRSAVGSTAESS